MTRGSGKNTPRPASGGGPRGGERGGERGGTRGGARGGEQGARPMRNGKGAAPRRGDAGRSRAQGATGGSGDRAPSPPSRAGARSGLGRPRPPRDDRPTGRSDPSGLGGDQVEGRQAVRELLLAGRRRVRALWLADGSDDAPILQEIEELAAEARVAVRRVSREHLLAQARTEAPQGVLAQAAPLDDVDIDELFRVRDGRLPFVLAVDSLTDPQNLGALLRTADGAGVTGVVLPSHRNVHITPAVTKAAAGAIERMPMALVGGLPSAMLHLHRERLAWMVGLDADATTSVFDLTHLASEPIMVVVGAEGAGLSRLVSERCDTLASIPLRGALASLNASAAGAVALFELGRHRS